MVAAGSGVRLGGSGPKALRAVGDAPLVRHAVALMADVGAELVVVTVQPHEQPAFERALAGVGIPVRLIAGGAERQDSVRLGLAGLADSAPGREPGCVVLVQDTARPLVPREVADRVIAAVRGGAEAVIPVIGVSDTIRRLSDGGSTVIDRTSLRAVQTPQGFRLAALIAAHEDLRRRGDVVTDDAAACEAVGHRVELVEGSPDSIKITAPVDLLIAEGIWRERQAREVGRR